MLATAGIASVAATATPRRRRLLRRVAPLMAVAGLAAVAESFAIPLQHLDDQALYFPRDDSRVLEGLRAERPGGGGVVMNSFLSGLFVPALSGQTTYIGFPFETLDVERKQREAAAFYRLTDGDALRRQAGVLGVNYVFYGRYERGFGGPDPGPLAGWREIGRSGDAVVYATSP
jgi:hypothetical protein